MTAWTILLDSRRWRQDVLCGQPTWTPQIRGITGTLRRTPARLTSKTQSLATNDAARCSSLTTDPSHPNLCVVRERSSSEGRSQELLWRQYFLDPTLWWDNRQQKQNPSSPDFRQKETLEVLWLNNFYKPAWVDEQLAALDMQMGRRSPTSKSRLSDDPDRRRLEALSKLCEQGQLREAVEALEVLMRTRSRISKSLIYAVLKQCVVTKDLGLGRRVHTITVKMGYESDTLLCNHILRMYASHARLQEAMDVFSVAAKPDGFMWFSIISAHVRHGQGKEAIQLYYQMRSSSVRPDGHVFVAALQACTVGEDLKTGQQVHADVLASGVEPDLFVNSCLVDMYAKCGSLEDAQRVFDGISQKNVVTWTALISGYSQQGMGQKALCLYSAMQEEGITAPNSVTFVCLLQACASLGITALEKGKQLHVEIEERGFQADVAVGGSLVNMYAKCGSLENAQRVFDQISRKNVVTWNAMISGYVQQGMCHEALCLYTRMQQEGTTAPDSVTFVCLLQACAGETALENGKQLHIQIEERGLEADVVVGGSLVNMYAKCGSLEDAKSVFCRLSQKNAVTWSALVAGYAQEGMGQEALSLYNNMQQEGITAFNSATFVSLLQACASLGTMALEKGKQLHAQVEERGCQADVVVGCSLVNMYAKCGSVEDAQRVFDRLSHKNLVTWNAMIAGYSQQGMGQEALRLYSAMQQEGLMSPDSVTFVCLLQACAGIRALQPGRELHAEIEEYGLDVDVVVGNSLINMYAKCGSLEDAQRVFDGISQKDVVTWNVIMAGYAQQGMGQEALRLHSIMQQEGITAPNSVTFVCLLQACAGETALENGKQLHTHIEKRGLETDMVVGGSLVNMYAKCGSLEDAQRVFDRISQRSVLTWNAMIAGYAQQGMGREALCLYTKMQQEGFSAPDSVAFVCLLQACASVGITAVEKGKQLHAQIEERGLEADVVVGCSLVNMYAKCGSLEDARRVFDRIPDKNVVTWTAMIAGYAQQGLGQEALRLYSAMQQEGIAVPDSATFVCLLQACASLAALHPGKKLHAQVEEQGLQPDMFVASSLINMYAKCGSMPDAQEVFDALPERKIVAWDALIAGYARQGDSEVVFDLVHRMREDCKQPSSITFLSVLTVCSHAGLVNKGREYFETMSENCGITPTVEHYTCMVDLLARAGQLDEALEVVRTMPVQPHDAVWHALLGACRKWSNVEVGRHAFDEAVKLDEKDAAAYVMMSNIYTGAQMWEEAQEIKARRQRIGAWKQPGQSWWADMSGIVHAFQVGDKQHPDSESIYARLQQLIPRMKKEGYVPHFESSLRGISDDEKEAHLCGHSEKLAIAYALNKTPEGTTIRIVKNLRVCVDCHTATAYISKIEKRTIICRDASRFHVYKDGKCSCGDYW